MIDAVTKKLDFGFAKFALIKVNAQRTLFQTLKNDSKMILMLIFVWGSNENIIDICKNKIKISESAIYVSLEGLARVSKTKGQNRIFV